MERNRVTTTVQIITSSKGGSGKTPLALSLFNYWHKRGKRILFIDFNWNNPDITQIILFLHTNTFHIEKTIEFSTEFLQERVHLVNLNNDNLYLVIRKHLHRPLGALNGWIFLYMLLQELKFYDFDIVIVDTVHNFPTLFPSYKNREQLNNVATLIEKMLTNGIRFEFYNIVDVFRLKVALTETEQTSAASEISELHLSKAIWKGLTTQISDEYLKLKTTPNLSPLSVFYVFSLRPFTFSSFKSTFLPLAQPGNEVAELIRTKALKEIINAPSTKAMSWDEFKDFLLHIDYKAAIKGDSLKNLEKIDFKILDQLVFKALVEKYKRVPLEYNLIVVPFLYENLINFTETFLCQAEPATIDDLEQELSAYFQLMELWFERIYEKSLSTVEKFR